jgi:gliding motility associated protien GldN
MKKTLLFAVLGLSLIFCNSKLQGQDNTKEREAYVREHIRSKLPVPYPYTREGDVLWSKFIWRIVDLREKMNFPLYFPTAAIGDRINLISLLLYGIDNEGLTAYNTDDLLNEFKVPMTKEEIDLSMGAKQDTQKIPDPSTGQIISKVIKKDRQKDEIKQIMIKEQWFFDKSYSTMQVRILGLCPIRLYYKEDPTTGLPTDALTKGQTFWIYYPEARKILVNHEIYNRNNESQRVSFDDFFFQRRFSSYIYRESNVYNNRAVSEYSPGVESLYESDRIKESLFTIEHDLWEY